MENYEKANACLTRFFAKPVEAFTQLKQIGRNLIGKLGACGTIKKSGQPLNG
jgi:hypothetical protein